MLLRVRHYQMAGFMLELLVIRVLQSIFPEIQIAWHFEDAAKKFPYYASAAVTSNVVAVGGRDKVMRALNPDTGKILWEFRDQSAHRCITCDRRRKCLLLGILRVNYLHLDMNAGKQVWKFDMGSAVLGSPAVDDHKFVIGSKDGTRILFWRKIRNHDRYFKNLYT